MALAEDAAATKPNRASRLGPLCSHHQPLLPTDPRTTPNALSSLRRHHPREEPGALAAHAGICAGGAQQRASLPRPCCPMPLARLASFRLDVRGRDHLAPNFSVSSTKTENCGRSAFREGSLADQPLKF